MNTPPSVSARLRQIRLQQNLTLKQVEIKSRGKWKAVVVGSYERGNRSLSVAKADELCNFYGVPLHQLFAEPNQEVINALSGSTDSEPDNWRIDLRKLREMQHLPDDFSHLIYQFLQQISIRRNDWNGEILTIRISDQEILGLLTRRQRLEVKQALIYRELLLKY